MQSDPDVTLLGNKQNVSPHSLPRQFLSPSLKYGFHTYHILHHSLVRQLQSLGQLRELLGREEGRCVLEWDESGWAQSPKIVCRRIKINFHYFEITLPTIGLPHISLTCTVYVKLIFSWLYFFLIFRRPK